MIVRTLPLVLSLALPTLPCLGEPAPVTLKITPMASISGDSTEWDWWQTRTAYIPGSPPRLLTTMSRTGRKGVHNFHDIYESSSNNHGKSWSQPAVITSLKRAKQPDGYEVAPGDYWPTFHAKSGKVLATGKTFNFEGGTKEQRIREQVAYTVMDPATNKWGSLKTVAMPKKDHAGRPIMACNAGCTQRVDLPNGDILLPVRYQKAPTNFNYTSIVALCSFDGETLRYQKHGSELDIPKGRGLYEPSLAKFKNRYFLTLRGDFSAYVARGKDGINYEPLQEWKFDDGKVLGSYNTQAHWLNIGDALFLLYTRKGADNDHIFRHRAPLFIAQVDPDTLRVIRATERIVSPANEATLGNFGVCYVNEKESWITVGEGLLRMGKRKMERNKVLVYRITVDK